MEKLVVITNTELIKLIDTCVRSAFKEHLGPAPDKESDILTHMEAAIFLHMSPQTLYGYCHRLQVPYLKGGGDPSRRKAPNLYSKKELTLWQQNGRQLTKQQIEALATLHSFSQKKK